MLNISLSLNHLKVLIITSGMFPFTFSTNWLLINWLRLTHMDTLPRGTVRHAHALNTYVMLTVGVYKDCVLATVLFTAI